MFDKPLSRVGPRSHPFLGPSLFFLLLGFSVAGILTVSTSAYGVGFTENVVDASQPSQPWMKEIADIDNDGIDDGWEMKWFLNLTTATHTSDFDGDGYTDLQEYLNDLAGEKDPLLGVYDPKTPNAPGGTGYIAPEDEGKFWLMILPAVINGR